MPSKLHLVASEQHYADHLLPVFAALPEHMKGDQVIGRNRRWNHETDLLLIAGYADVQRSPGVPYFYVEHGAGQSYGVIPAGGSYSGGPGHNYCRGFICPNTNVAMRWLARYPITPSAVVGSPRLDDWHTGHRGDPERNTVAITFHWDALHTGVPETASAFGHYFQCLPDLIQRWERAGWRVLGHWHPRYPAVGEFWRSLRFETGIEVVSDAAEVLDRASVLVADNTSMQAEFLSLGRRVVWLNHPGYRRDVELGGRFWTWPRTYGGSVVDDARSLLALDLDSVPEPTGSPYAFADGLASQRAAQAISFWLRSLEVPS